VQADGFTYRFSSRSVDARVAKLTFSVGVKFLNGDLEFLFLSIHFVVVFTNRAASVAESVAVSYCARTPTL